MKSVRKLPTFSIRFAGVAVSLLIAQIVAGQNVKDTIKTNKPNDPMAVNPGKVNDANAMMTDTGFITKNIADNLVEIQMAKAGRDKGSAQVKKLSALLIADHTVMLNELRRLAAAKHAGSTKTHMGGMPSMAPSTEGDVTGESDFNAAWASEMLTMHEAKIKELENFMSVSQDADIKALAGKALPKIIIHRDMLLKIPGAKSKAVNTL